MNGDSDTIRRLREFLSWLTITPQLRDEYLGVLDALVAENQRLRRERDDFEQRLHAYKSGEVG